jgi:hypothetical protein
MSRWLQQRAAQHDEKGEQPKDDDGPVEGMVRRPQ